MVAREDGMAGRPTPPATMKAVRVHRYGGPEELVYEDAPRPVAGEGEVLVRVNAAGVNPVDWKTRAGRGVAELWGYRLPVILGWDVSGVVEAVGSGVDRFAVGDEVFGMVRFPMEGAAYAEYVAAPANELVRKPAAIDHVAAAAVPLAALTAWQALFEAGELAAGRTVLIHAAAGGVGHLAVQLAKARGARVIGTASAANQEFVRDLGVDLAVDYRTTRFEEVARDVDVVLESISDEVQERSFGVLRPGGVLVSLGPVLEAAAAARGVRARAILVRPEAGHLAEIARLIEVGGVRPAVEAVVPLAAARRAHERSERGRTRGKIVLRVVP